MPYVIAAAVLGLLPVLPIMIHGSPVLNNDMLVAYFCYFWDFHRNWSWSHPFVFWSSSYQCGMPMHAYWQTGYLYPITWMLFGPLSPYYGIYLFYAFHFFLAIAGFLKLGPQLKLHKTASLWAGICFGLSGTMLARYEHATFLSGWAWMPLVLSLFLSLRDQPGLKNLFLYAAAVALQALGGHPQASATTAILIGAFTMMSAVTSVLPRKNPVGRGDARAGARVKGSGPRGSAGPDSASPNIGPAPSRPKRLGWIFTGHALAMFYCAPLLAPFLALVNGTDRFDGTAWEETRAPELTAAGSSPAADAKGFSAGARPGESAETGAGRTMSAAAKADAAQKLETGVFGFEKFSTGGMRPLHLLSLIAPHALGTPSNASWWGGEAWGEVFVYLGALGLFFCAFAAWGRASPDMRALWIIGLIGLWIAFGAHLGASQILYHVPVFNNFRRPARFMILFVIAVAALSGHGFQRWIGKPRGGRWLLPAAIAALLLSLIMAAVAYSPRAAHAVLNLVQHAKKLDAAKDYAAKMSALLGRDSVDFAFIALSAAALWFFVRSRSRAGLALLFILLSADLLRLHWDHFYLFPSDYYHTPPRTAAFMDRPSEPFWRVSHYLEYPGLEMWDMHNDPVAHFGLFEREKLAMSCGVHAVFGYRHVSAHLPLIWKWDADLTPGMKSARYLFSNRALSSHAGDSLRLLGQVDSVRAYEIETWRPRLETASHRRNAMIGSFEDSTSCPQGFSGYGGLCVHENRDGDLNVQGKWENGDTLYFRERFDADWKYRASQNANAILRPSETHDHFMAIPLDATQRELHLFYSPTGFFRLVGLCGLVSAVLALLALPRFFRSKEKA